MNIVIIEHENFSTENIRHAFLDNGYNVFMCSSKEEVVDFVETRCPSLLLLPANELGYSVSRFIRSSKVIDYNLSSTPILFLGESDNTTLRGESISNGGSDFVDRSNLGKIIKASCNLLEPDLVWKGAKIAIVEDDKVSARLLSSYVENMGSIVKWFENGQECLDYLKDESIDLLLVDYIMPFMNGAELTRKIRNDLGLKELPIIFTSSTFVKEEILEFYNSGGNDYISKPFLKEEVYTKIKLQLENSQNTRSLNEYIKELKNLSNVKDQFLAVCSHDLKTPLNSIIGYSDVLMQDAKMEKDEKDILGIINNASKDLLSLVDDILKCTEVHLSGQIDMDNIPLDEVIKYIFKQVKGISSKQLDYTFENEGPAPIIRGNEALLRRVFSNIYSNAHKFTPSGGKIETRIWEEGDTIKCSISDSGIGIPSDSIDRVFSRLSGVGRVGLEGQKSTGLGLSIVKDIIVKHGGSISVVSEENVGTTFTLSFTKGR